MGIMPGEATLVANRRAIERRGNCPNGRPHDDQSNWILKGTSMMLVAA
jgi:hypothetical protein